MSWDVPVDQAISTAIEALLPPFSNKYKGIGVSVSLSGSDGTDRHKQHATLIFLRPDRYMKVFGAPNIRLTSGVLASKPEDWGFYCDHDSSWRVDGYRLLREMKAEMSGGSTKCCSIHKFEPLFVEYERDGDSYRMVEISHWMEGI